jgi:hypothetical protein
LGKRSDLIVVTPLGTTRFAQKFISARPPFSFPQHRLNKRRKEKRPEDLGLKSESMVEGHHHKPAHT